MPLFALAAYGSAAFTALFTLAAVAAARRFRGLDRAPSDWLPPVTVLKPIKGMDEGMYRNLASFLDQDHPRFQVLFCLQSPEDPAIELLKKLREDFPRVDSDIVISKNRIGYNPKINNLSNAYGFAKHDLLMISDSDVRVERDFLRRVVAPLADPAVGVVTCFYRSTGASTPGSKVDALSVNAHFLPQAMVAALLGGMRFAMGAVMLVRRQAFEAAGGLLALSGHLADDYVLGRVVAAAGYRVELSPVMVDSTADQGTLVHEFAHLVRWSRTIRVCNPAGYLGSVLLHGGPLLLLHAALGGGAHALAAWAALELLRATALGWMHARYLGNREILRQLAWLPVSEAMQLAAWVAGLRSSTVFWRGESYAVTTGGRLVPRGAKASALRAAA